jgi:hypothetical protein
LKDGSLVLDEDTKARLRWLLSRYWMGGDYVAADHP